MRHALVCVFGGLFAVTACVESSLVPCGDLVCPIEQVCTSGGCAMPENVSACAGAADGSACVAVTGQDGTCQGGSCRTGLCGNGVVDPSEICDDGGQISGDGCRADCLKIEVCNDGELDEGEACDDGNTNTADGCDACRRTAWDASVIVGAQQLAVDAELAQPNGIAIDGLGRVFFADTAGHRIRRIDPDGSIRVIAGTGEPGRSGDGGQATSARLTSPWDVKVDGLGQVFILDSGNHAVRRIATDGTIATIAGTGVAGAAGDGGPATGAQLASPRALAIDNLGRVLIADTQNYRIRRIELDGTLRTIAGTGVVGQTGTDGPADAAGIDSVLGIAVDDLGQIYLAETVSSMIRRIGVDGVIRRFAGTGIYGSSGDGGPALGAAVRPYGIALDPLGRLLLVETAHRRVRRIDTSGTITTVAGNGTPGFSGDGGPATAAQLIGGNHVGADALGQIYIPETFEHRIRRVDQTGTIITIAGTGTTGVRDDGSPATGSPVFSPQGLAFDALGRVVIADSAKLRVIRIELDGTITTIAGSGIDGFAGDGGPATSARVRPHGIAYDSTGRLVIADRFNHRIRRVALDGTITTIAGTGTAGGAGDGGPATSAQIHNPYSVAIDATDRILIAELSGYRIRRIEADGTITTIAGTGTNGTSGDGGLATAAQLATPAGVAIDALGRISISLLGSRTVRRIDENGIITTIATNLGYPTGLAVDALGRVLIADRDSHVVRRVEASGTVITLAGTTSTTGLSGDAGPAMAAAMSAPQVVAVDALGRVLIGDSTDRVVRQISPDTGTILTIAGRVDPPDVPAGALAKARLGNAQAIAIAGATTLIASGSSGTLEVIRADRVEVAVGRYPQLVPTANLARFRDATFGDIGGTAVDPMTGLIYITETTNHRVHAITLVDPARPHTWTIAPVVNPAGTAGTADGPAGSAGLHAPTGLWFDAPSRTLYIADTGNHAIRALAVDTGSVTTVANSRRRRGLDGDGGPALGAQLCAPTAITRCGNGDLFVADTCNHRVRRIAGDQISTVLGDGAPASSGEGAPAFTFPVHAPRGLACDAQGNLFVASTTTVRMLPATGAVVDGSGPVQTIYGAPPRTAFPLSNTSCLTGLAVTGPTSVQVVDACTGLLVQLERTVAP